MQYFEKRTKEAQLASSFKLLRCEEVTVVSMMSGFGSCNDSKSNLTLLGKRSSSSREMNCAVSTTSKCARIDQQSYSTQRVNEASSGNDIPEQFECDKEDAVKMDAIQYKIDRAGKNASSSLKEILLQIKSLEERNVPVEIYNIPDDENLKLERIIERVLHEIPEYLPGKFILKTPQSSDKGKISGEIYTALRRWNGGTCFLDSIMTTNQNQRRAADVEWRQFPITDAQRNNSAQYRPMPDLWIEICYNRTGDRNAEFGKIQAHLPSHSTVFVTIVLANQVSPAMRQRLGVIGAQAVPPTIRATALATPPRFGPYIAVWNLGSVNAVYYDVRRGHYVDIRLTAHAPNLAPVFRFDMDLICQSLQ
jgi:hypothetical protein